MIFPWIKKIPHADLDSLKPEDVLVQLDKEQVVGKLAANVERIRQIMGQPHDLVVRQLKLPQAEVALIYLSGLVDRISIEKILDALLLERPQVEKAGIVLGGNLQKWQQSGMPIGEVSQEQIMGGAIRGLLAGKTILVADNCKVALLLETKKWEERQVSEPEVESAVRGPREGFVENINVNLSLIRRRLRHPNLRVERQIIGDLSNTQVMILYIEGLAPKSVLEELRSRLGRIKLDGVLESNYLEELIADAPFSVFPQVDATERPDRVTAGLLEGRVALLTDGTPFALKLPMVFINYLQAVEDYYQNWILAFGLRLLRLLSLLIALLLPAVYVALTTYHQEMLPTSLAVSLAIQREHVPYPAVVEALAMQIIFEILVEAGLRLPKTLGQAVSIVGALVIGEAAVRAGLISEAMVIVVSATAISSFLFPAYGLSLVIRLLRIPMIILSASLGLFGIFVGIMLILIHLVNLRSFGVPYLTGIAPFVPQSQGDIIMRAPWWKMLRRPKITGYRDPIREKEGLKPGSSVDGREDLKELDAEISQEERLRRK